MSSAAEVAADWGRLAATVVVKVQATVAAQTILLHAAVKSKAREPRTTPRPGPGGPRLLTGAYNRSIHYVVAHRAGMSTGTVGTNAVQGPRLEGGFHGVDSAGRSIDQQAYPHFSPALDERADDFTAAIAAAGTPSKGPR